MKLKSVLKEKMIQQRTKLTLLKQKQKQFIDSEEIIEGFKILICCLKQYFDIVLF